MRDATTLGDMMKGTLFNSSALQTVKSGLRDALAGIVTGLASGKNLAADLGISTGTAASTLDQDAIAGRLKFDAVEVRRRVRHRPRQRQGDADARRRDGRRRRHRPAHLRPHGGLHEDRRADPAAIDGSTDQVKRLQDQIDNMNTRLQAREDQLKAQFTAMETAIAQLKSSGDSLSSALSSLSANNDSGTAHDRAPGARALRRH